jgi:hypothetical protein
MAVGKIGSRRNGDSSRLSGGEMHSAIHGGLL